MAQPRRSVWFWVSLFWLAALMFSNMYDARLEQSSTFLPGELGNLVALLLLLVLSYFYTWSHRWVGGALAALGLLALAAAKFGGVADGLVGVIDLACAAGLFFAPFRSVRPARPQPSQRYRRRDA